MVTRGCIKDLEQNDYEQLLNEVKGSSLCLEDGCNDQIVKVNRYCYECDSENDPRCVSEMHNSMVKQCPESEQDLGCYHKTDGIYLQIRLVSDFNNCIH